MNIAGLMARSDNPRPCSEAPSVDELKEGLQRQRIRNVVASRQEERLQIVIIWVAELLTRSSWVHRKYEKLVNDLLDCLEDRDL